MTFNIFKWFHDELVALRAAVARLEGHTSAPESKPVPKPDEVTTAFGPPAASPPVDAGVQGPSGWIAFKDYPNYGQLVMKLGHGLDDAQVKEWMTATGQPDPRSAPTPSVDPNGAQNSASPLASFTKAYDHGRWPLQKGQEVTVPVNVPPGPYHFTLSGRGGTAGGDSSAHVKVSVTSPVGEIGSGNESSACGFQVVQPGTVTLHLTADRDTVQDVTLSPNLA